MAWQDEMSVLLRSMLFDFGDPPTYPDTTVESLLVAAAQLVSAELDFTQKFAADLNNTDILPDPTDTDAGTRDDNFINLVCMKAAAIVDLGVARQQSGIVIRDNGSMVDLHYKLDAAMRMLEVSGGWSKLYQDFKLRYANGLLDGSGGGAVVLSSFRHIARNYRWGCSPREGCYN